MPKSYKICKVLQFESRRFGAAPLPLKGQYLLAEVAAPPQTLIYRARDQLKLGDYESFLIEHEHEVAVRGRINGQTFDKFIRQSTINAFFSQSAELLLLSGKKDDILDFCRTTPTLQAVRLATIRVDMKALLERLAEVRIVWFRFPSGLITASALMGSNVEKTEQFAESRAEGDITTLSFHFGMDGGIHPIMVTEDGAVVLQHEYTQTSDEIELVRNVKGTLLDGIYAEEEIRPGRRVASR